MRQDSRTGNRSTPSLLLSAVIMAACSGIPVNEGTEFVPADSADWLAPDELVLGLAYEGQIRAYPISALGPIEVLNDVVHDHPVVVTWCPLSGTGAVFSSQVHGLPQRFRFLMELNKGNLLFEDMDTKSVWSQLAYGAVRGPSEGARLELLPTVQTTWSEWRRSHPGTTVLRPEWGSADFSYREVEEEPVPGSRSRRELALVVFGIPGVRVYPFKDLAKANGLVLDTPDGHLFALHFAAEGPTAFATDDAGSLLPSMVLYWGYLERFFPDAEVWTFGVEDGGGSGSPTSE